LKDVHSHTAHLKNVGLLNVLTFRGETKREDKEEPTETSLERMGDEFEKSIKAM
jgi:hypothetical protein